jgi:hypothetical protein
VERDKPKKIRISWTNCRSCHRNKKGGIKKKFGFLSSNFMKLCKNIHQCVAAFWGLKKFKMAMVTKVQKMLNSNHTVDPFEK